MKRIPQLRDLSDDHHHGLVLARKAKLAATGEGELRVEQVWSLVETSFENELEPHFQIEETFIASVLKAEGELEIANRLFSEHAALRAFVVPGSPRSARTLGEFGELLRQHIRFEERELFELAQRVLSPEALRGVANACQARSEQTMNAPQELHARIGIDLGGTKIEGVRLEHDGSIAQRLRVPTPHDSYTSTLDAITELVNQLHAGTETAPTVGICTPGAISPATGNIKNANSTCLNGRALREDLEHRLERPVRVANDANCFALSEAVDGAAKNASVVFGVILGTGVGGGIVVDRKALVGPNAIAGEWGHNALPWREDHERPGPACYCGRTGCIETFLSGPGLTRDHHDSTGERLSGEAIVNGANQGDATATATLERFEERLARALAMVINLLDPDMIVLGGGLSTIERLYTNVPRLWNRHVFSDRVDTPLQPPLHGGSGGVRGAAWLWG